MDKTELLKSIGFSDEFIDHLEHFELTNQKFESIYTSEPLINITDDSNELSVRRENNSFDHKVSVKQ